MRAKFNTNRDTIFRGFDLSKRKAATRTSQALIVYYNYKKQNFKKPTNLTGELIANSTLTNVEVGVIDDEIENLSISKAISQPSATFEVTLLPTENWKRKIAPGDWVLIYLFNSYRPKEIPADTKNLVLIGNVDRVSRKLFKDEDSDQITLRYSVSGRNFGKALEETDVWYDPYSEQVSTLDAALRKAGLPLNGTPDTLVKSLLDIFLGYGGQTKVGSTPNLENWIIPSKLTNPFANPESEIQPSASGVSRLYDIIWQDIRSGLPGFKAREMLTLDSNGSLWDMMKRNSNQPINELIVDEIRDGDGLAFPTIYLAPRPIQTPFFEDLFSLKKENSLPAKEKTKTKVTHKVVSGDWISKIAAQYKTTVNAILKLNPSVKNPDLIYPGQVLVVKEEIVETQKQPKADLLETQLSKLDDAWMTLQTLAKENFLEIAPTEIKYEDLGKDENSRFNLFWLRLDPQTYETQFSWGAYNTPKGFTNPTFQSGSIKRHGLRRYDQLIEFCHTTDGSTGASSEVELYRAFMAQIYDMHFANHLYDAGTIECTGILEMELGKALIVKADPTVSGSKDKVYYVEGYQHDWSFPDGWTTTVTVTHGQWLTDGRNIFIDIEEDDYGEDDRVLNNTHLAKTGTKR